MKNLEKKDYILIGILAVLIIILLIVVNKDKTASSGNKSVSINNSDYVLIGNKSVFFTIEGCANRYINALYSKNTDDLLKLLDETYVNENLITKDNVISKLGALEGMHNIRAKKILQEKTNKKIFKYYFYGLLQKDINGEYDLGTDYYLIINVDKDNNLFSVTPYNGDIFKEAN